jgi:hypothetical protein
MKKASFYLAFIAVAFGSTAPISAQTIAEGFLCCTVRFDYYRNINRASDANWVEFRSHLKAGTAVKVSRYEFRNHYGTQTINPYDFAIASAGQNIVLKNEYTKHMSPPDYLSQLVVATDPKVKIAGFSKEVQEAIASARVAVGMSKEQVAMAMGYPLKKENPNPDTAVLWRYYYGSFDEILIVFGADGLVRGIEGLPFALADAVYPAPPPVKK